MVEFISGSTFIVLFQSGEASTVEANAHTHTHTHTRTHTHTYTHTHTDSVNVLFSMKYSSRHEKKISARKLHRHYCHPPFSFL